MTRPVPARSFFFATVTVAGATTRFSRQRSSAATCLPHQQKNGIEKEL